MTQTAEVGSYREVFVGRLGVLTLGLLILEFIASVQTFIVSTVLPEVSSELNGSSLYGVAVTASTISLFVSLPVVAYLTPRFGLSVILNGAAVVYVVGGMLNVLAPEMWVFVLGRLIQGFASGALASFGLSAVVSEFPERLRPRLIALMSSMWLIPALAGPTIAAVTSTFFGWRWTLAASVPAVLLGRLLVGRRLASVTVGTGPAGKMSVKPSLLLVFGVVAILVTGVSAKPWQIGIGLAGVVIAMWGATLALPSGTFTGRKGSPAALAGFFVLTFVFFGGDALVTLFVRESGGSISLAAIALGSGTVAWVLSGAIQPRLLELVRNRLDIMGLLATLLVTVGVGALFVALFCSASGATASVICVAAWILSGLGMGLGYPTLSVAGMASSEVDGAAKAAASVILAESLGGALGLAIGGTAVSVSSSLHGSTLDGLRIAYGVFASACVLLVFYVIRLKGRAT